MRDAQIGSVDRRRQSWWGEDEPILREQSGSQGKIKLKINQLLVLYLPITIKVFGDVEGHCDAEMMTEDVNHFFESWEDLYREAVDSADMMPPVEEGEEDRGNKFQLFKAFF